MKIRSVGYTVSRERVDVVCTARSVAGEILTVINEFVPRKTNQGPEQTGYINLTEEVEQRVYGMHWYLNKGKLLTLKVLPGSGRK